MLSVKPEVITPERLTWERLRDVQFKKKFYAEEGVILLHPTFGPTVQALNGKKVTISGYVIPIDLENGSVLFLWSCRARIYRGSEIQEVTQAI